MANYQFSSDLVNDVLFRAGEPTDGTSDFEAPALQYVNRAYQAIWMGGIEIAPEVNEPWWWLFKEANFVTELPISAGTVSVTQNSASITFSSPPAASVVGFWFKVTGTNEIYKVSAHTGGAGAATLDSIYLGATDGAAAYTLFKTDYTLAADVLRLVTPMRLGQTNASGSSYTRPGRNYQILGVSNRELDEIAPLSLASAAIPKLFAQTGEAVVRVDSYSSTRIRVDYQYMQRPADLTDSGSEEPVIPRQYRRLIADVAVMFLMIDKNDDRARAVAALARTGLLGMAQENRVRLQVYGPRVRELAPKPIMKLPQRENETLNRTLLPSTTPPTE